MAFDPALDPADLILQDSLRVLECIIDRNARIGVTGVAIRLAPDIDLLPVGQAEVDVDLEEAAGPMARSRTFHRDTACGDSVEPLLERRNVTHDRVAQLVGWLYVLKVDMGRRLHRQILKGKLD